MADEPLEGQHWDMISSHSTSSDEPWSDDDRARDTPHIISDSPDTPSSPNSPLMFTESSSGSEGEGLRLKGLWASLVEGLRREQYWTDDWRSEIDVGKPFDLGDPSTLGMSFDADYLT